MTHFVMIRSALFLLLLAFALPTSVLADEIPEEAMLAARRDLDYRISRAIRDPKFLRSWNLEDTTGLSTLKFGDPYTAYVMGTALILDYANADDIDMLSFAEFYYYGFPVFSDKGEFVLTLLIYRNINPNGEKYMEDWGEYIGGGAGDADNRLEQLILDLQKRYPPSEGYSVLLLRTLGLSWYFVVRKENGEAIISPVERADAEGLSLYPDAEGQYPFISMTEANPMLKEKARRYAATHKWRLAPMNKRP
jgi:hypothetical protein